MPTKPKTIADRTRAFLKTHPGARHADAIAAGIPVKSGGFSTLRKKMQMPSLRQGAKELSASQQAREYLKKHPTASHKEVLAAGIHIGQSGLSDARRSLGIPKLRGAGKGENKQAHPQLSEFKEWIRQNPDGNYLDFLAAFPKVKDYKSSAFYFWKGTIKRTEGRPSLPQPTNGKTRSRRFVRTTYQTVWARDIQDLSPQQLHLCEELVEALVTCTGQKLSLVHIAKPQMLELRKEAH